MHDDHPTSRPSRRQVLRASAWVPPVVLAVEAAPAFAASVGPLVVTGSKTLTALVLTFNGGSPGLSATISSVTYTLLGVTNGVTMSPKVVTNTQGGTSSGGLLSATLVLTLTYTVVYVYNGQSFTALVTV